MQLPDLPSASSLCKHKGTLGGRVMSMHTYASGDGDAYEQAG